MAIFLELVEPPAVIISDATGSSVTVSLIHSKKFINKILPETQNNNLLIKNDNDQRNYVLPQLIDKNNKVNGKCFLLQPRRETKKILTHPTDNSESVGDKSISINMIDQSLPIKIFQLPKQNVTDNFHDYDQSEQTNNDWQYSIEIDENNKNNQTFQQYPNFHLIRQLQLFRHLEVSAFI